MKTVIEFIDSKTNTRSNCADHFHIECSSRDLGWEGLLVEKGQCDHFHTDQIVTKDFYFAMLIDSELNWNIEVNGYSTPIYSPPETTWINPPNTPFSNIANSRITFLNVLISEDLLFKHYKNHVPEAPLSFLRDYNIQDSFMSHMMYMFLEEVANKGRNGQHFRKHLLTLFSNYFIDNYSNIHELNNNHDQSLTPVICGHQLEKLDTYIRQHIYEVLTIEDLARALKMTKFHFLREFKKLKGITPYQYLISFRIETSKDLLTRTDRTIIDIAHALGFSDRSHFSRTFKKYTGQTPTHFRLSNKTP